MLTVFMFNLRNIRVYFQLGVLYLSHIQSNVPNIRSKLQQMLLHLDLLTNTYSREVKITCMYNYNYILSDAMSFFKFVCQNIPFNEFYLFIKLHEYFNLTMQCLGPCHFESFCFIQ